MITSFFEFAVYALEMLTVGMLVLFVGVLDSKYYEKIRLVDAVWYDVFLVCLLFTNFFLSQWCVEVGNLPGLLAVQAVFHLVMLWELRFFYRRLDVVEKLKYTRQRRIATGVFGVALFFEFVAALTASLWWLSLCIS